MDRDDMILISVDDPFKHVPKAQATVGTRRASVAGHDVSVQPRAFTEKRSLVRTGK